MLKNNNSKVKISYHAKDIVCKQLCDDYTEIFFDILNINSMNKDLISVSSEIAEIQSFKFQLDKVFIADRKIIIHIEFDSSGKSNNLTRYMIYAAHLSYKFSNLPGKNIYGDQATKKKIYPVRTIVIYPANVTIPSCVYTVEGSLLYTIEQISLADLINGVEILAELKKKKDLDPSFWVRHLFFLI
jgi:hypothetical protein